MAPKSRSKKGHNSLSADVLRSIIERVDRLDEERQAAVDDIKEVYAEAKSNGFDTKQIKRLRKIMAQDASKRSEENEILRMYAGVLDIDPFS